MYGNKPNFQVGAVLNVLEAKRLYPDWKCRFYTTDDEGICRQLEYLGAEVVRMDDHWMNQGYSYGSLWRFLAVDDADICIFRDTDSVVNERELGAVNEWLDSDYQWHIMHDHKHHRGSKIMAGMFGYRHHDECNIPETLAQKSVSFFDFQKKDSMLQLIKDWLNGSVNTSKSFDQKFLTAVIHPKIKNNFLSHGTYGKQFPSHDPCRYGNFVGDYSFWSGGWKEFVNGDKKPTSTPAPEVKYDRILNRVIVSCDSHPDYLDFWPLAVSAWKKIDVKATLVLIEKPDENIEVDETIGDVIRIRLKDDSVHSAFIAQAVRLLAPCLYPDENITIADVDIIPLSKDYLFKNLCRASEDSFLEYRHGCVGGDQVAMCWNAAKGSVWGDIFGISATTENYEDVFINRLKEWSPPKYKPISQGKSAEWFEDQRLLYQHLSRWSGEHVKLTDSECVHRRLDHRTKHPPGMHDYYTDFCPRRPAKMNLAHLGRVDLDNMDTIKHVFDWYKIPWIYDGEANMIEKQPVDNQNTNQQGFTHVFKNRSFGKSESVSGPGSGDRQTQVLKKELKNLIGEYNIKSMFDCPCGDFYWMKDIINDASLLDVAYTGGDIVPEIIDNNKRDHGSLLNDKSNFIHFNIIEDTIPDVDLLFCRDLFVHLPTDTVVGLLNKIKQSNVKYFLATTFMNRENTDCPPVSASGAIGWRYVCLFTPPFSLPPPLKIISEVCTEGYPKSIDKSLGLWCREDLR